MRLTTLKIKFEVEIEYEANPENYPEGKRSAGAMLDIDLESANDDPFLFLSQDAEWNITGEVLK